MQHNQLPKWLQAYKPKHVSASTRAKSVMSNWLILATFKNARIDTLKAVLYYEAVGHRKQSIILNRVHSWIQPDAALRKIQQAEFWAAVAQAGELPRPSTNDCMALKRIRALKGKV